MNVSWPVQKFPFFFANSLWLWLPELPCLSWWLVVPSFWCCVQVNIICNVERVLGIIKRHNHTSQQGKENFANSWIVLRRWNDCSPNYVRVFNSFFSFSFHFAFFCEFSSNVWIFFNFVIFFKSVTFFKHKLFSNPRIFFSSIFSICELFSPKYVNFFQIHEHFFPKFWTFVLNIMNFFSFKSAKHVNYFPIHDLFSNVRTFFLNSWTFSSLWTFSNPWTFFWTRELFQVRELFFKSIEHTNFFSNSWFFFSIFVNFFKLMNFLKRSTVSQ